MNHFTTHHILTEHLQLLNAKMVVNWEERRSKKQVSWHNCQWARFLWASVHRWKQEAKRGVQYWKGHSCFIMDNAPCQTALYLTELLTSKGLWVTSQIIILISLYVTLSFFLNWKIYWKDVIFEFRDHPKDFVSISV